MRVKHSWVLALLLSGCQLTQPTDSGEAVSPETNNPTVKQTEPSAQPAKPIVKSEPVVTPQTQQDVWKRIAMQLEMPILIALGFYSNNTILALAYTKKNMANNTADY